MIWLHEKSVIKKTKKYDFQADRKHGISKSLLVIDDLIASDSGVYTAIVEDSTTGHKIEEKKRIFSAYRVVMTRLPYEIPL